ncbi:hypothetical protein [Pseudoalteromonas lipolytica]|nr:hypothetical protein [Pseudoalteromonas lipolytica]
MRISKLSFTNFRSFKEKQTIEFAPVTLFSTPFFMYSFIDYDFLKLT